MAGAAIHSAFIRACDRSMGYASILSKAKKIYAVGCNPRHFLNKTCCDFKLLEKKSGEYFLTIMDEAFTEYEAIHCSEMNNDTDAPME